MAAVCAQRLIRLLNEHSAALVLYAQQWCVEPEDIVQEAFLRLMRQRPAPDNAVGWLYRVVRNEAISASRKEATRARHEQAAGESSASWFTPSCDERIDANAIADNLVSLPNDQREAVVLRIWAGRSFQQIADITGKSTSAVHRHYVAALAALRDKWSVPCSSHKKPIE